jgi:cyclopropane-fatty-acyl-phospholipid synthase
VTATTPRGASAKAIQYHYDAGTDFYALWLDEGMSYSCALWEVTDDSLEKAQRRKLDYHLGACVPKGGRLLDIGCGWGAALNRAIEHHGVHNAVGLTLSLAQARHIESLGDRRVRVEVTDWADFESSEVFDGVVSIGAFEHFAKFGWTREQKTAAYRRFFEACHQWLVPGGILALQTIGKGNVLLDARGAEDAFFIHKHIFPESDVPSLSEVTTACERWFEEKSVRNDRLDYARTCQAWLERMRARESQAVSLVGEEKYGQYLRYLGACVRQFELGHANLYRLILRRADSGGSPRRWQGLY